MRTKTRGGKARLPKFHSASSTTPSFPLLDLDEADGERSIGWIEPGTSNKKNDDVVIASAYSDDETDIRTENHSGLDLSGDCMDLDQLEGGTCLKCDRDKGNLLHCSQFGCPISLHENCMNVGPKFDDEGNFYCPYCWYKREVVRTQELRKKAMEAKKALACFIDFQRGCSDREKENGRTDEGKEMNDRMDNDQVENQFMEVEEDQIDDRDEAKLADSSDQFKPVPENQRDPLTPLSHLGKNINSSHEKTLGVESPVNSTSKEISSEEKICNAHELEILEDGETIQVEDAGRSKWKMQEDGETIQVQVESDEGKETNDRMDNDQVENQFMEVEEDQIDDRDEATLADSSDQFKPVPENQRDPLTPLSHLGKNINISHEKTLGVESFVNSTSKEISREEKISNTHELEILEDGEMIQVEDAGQVDDSGQEKIVEDQLQEEPCNACCVEGENVADGSLNISKDDKSDPVKLKQGRREEEEKMDPKTLGTEMSDSDMETISVHQRRLRRSSRIVQSQNVDSPKKLSSPTGATPEKIARPRNEKVTASKNSTQQVSAGKFTGFTFANEKRKRLLWTAEEEDMLKEGVHKFSSKVNKNLPWRKVLEFGRHVFDPTRTPADLKDKWRNIVAKESSGMNRR